MRVKVRLVGGSWYDDDGLLWRGVLDELVSAGSHMLLSKGSMKVALNVVSVSVEIDSDAATYVLFVSPVSKVDNDMLKLYVNASKNSKEESDQSQA